MQRLRQHTGYSFIQYLMFEGLMTSQFDVSWLQTDSIKMMLLTSWGE